MYKLEINDLKELNLFLNLNDLEYVDLFLSRGKSILVSNTAELFAALSLYTECSADESSANIRLPRKMLASLVCEGNIIIKVKEHEVVLLFYANDQTQERYSVTLGRQEVFSASYDKKIQILSEIDNANRFNAGDIKDIVNIGRVASSVISCQNEVASVTLVGRGRVFKPIEFKNNFAVSAARLSRLLSVSNTLFDIENYVGVATKELSILATKSRGSDNSDFELIQHEKSNAVFEAKFAKGSDLFICEGMYGSDDNLDNAVKNYHMTFSEAASLARDAHVEQMWLTHYSPGLVDPEKYISNATNIFKRTMCAYDTLSTVLEYQ